MVATRAAVDRCGPGHVVTALRGQRTGPAPERGESELHHTAKDRKTPPPKLELFSLYEEEPGERRPASLAEPPGPQERVRSLANSFPRCRSSTLLCRRWWTSSKKSSSPSTSRCPSRLSKCPRSSSRTSRCEPWSVGCSWRNSWWKCQCFPSATASSRRRSHLSFWHGTWMQMAANGATARDKGGSTGCCRTHSTRSGPLRWDPPPAQGCILILGRAEAGRSGLRLWRPCDHAAQVPAVREVRQLGDASDSVIDRLLLLPVVPQRQVRTVQTVQKTEDPRGQFLERLLTRPSLCDDRRWRWSRQCRKQCWCCRCTSSTWGRAAVNSAKV